MVSVGTGSGGARAARFAVRDTTPSGNMKASSVLGFVFCVSGIYGAYLTQGFVSEALSRRGYGPDGERFGYLNTLVGFQCMTCFLWAGALWLVLESRSRKQLPPFWAYAKASISNVVGPSCGLLALKNITYPAQVLAKSCKMVPIMIAGTLLFSKRYSPMEYASAAAISLGVGLFAILSGKSKGTLQDANPALGYALVMGNLALDAYTNVAQDEINRVYRANTPLHMMCWMNFWGGLFYMLYLFILTTEGYAVLSFCSTFPAAGRDLALFCLCGALGQLFIFYTIKRFGSLITSIICTTRKFFSILISVMLAGTVLSAAQWGAVMLVFSGLLYKSILRLMM